MILSKFWFFALVILLALGLIILYVSLKAQIDKLVENNKPHSFLESISNLIDLILVLYIPFIFVFYNWYVPNVYVIENCNSYKTKVLLFPKKTKDLTMKLDSDNCYVINNSNSTIRLKSIVYNVQQNEYNKKVLAEIKGKRYKPRSGMLTMKELKMRIDKTIYPKQSFMLKYKKIHYIFKQPDISISIKRNSKVRYKLFCN